jgi:hypothetical protein
MSDSYLGHLGIETLVENSADTRPAADRVKRPITRKLAAMHFRCMGRARCNRGTMTGS